jgi:hypothetical protein
MSRNAIIVLVFVAAVAGMVVYSLSQVGKVTCEVCITFDGQQACRTGVGSNEEEAVRAATESACVVLVRGGMAERIACGHTAPTSKSCK